MSEGMSPYCSAHDEWLIMKLACMSGTMMPTMCEILLSSSCTMIYVFPGPLFIREWQSLTMIYVFAGPLFIREWQPLQPCQVQWEDAVSGPG